MANQEARSAASDEPVMVPVEAFISRDYARLEGEKLWRKTWQMACREEEIEKVGDFVTYEIADESIIVVRTDETTISAYYNVCPHRGRRLTEGCGHASGFYCKYHGWQWSLDGTNQKVVDKDDWKGALDDEFLRLKAIRIGRWAGYVFVNMDPDSESFEDFLGVVPSWLDPFEIGKMRYKWRQWLYFPCNWKVALEAFMEGYHVGTSHPQIMRWSDCHTWSRAEGRHSWFGNNARIATSAAAGNDASGMSERLRRKDQRKEIAAYMETMNTTVGLGTLTTNTIVEAARSLVDILPEDATRGEAGMTMNRIARQADAERGVAWPDIAPAHLAAAGTDWHIFPNIVVLHGPTYLLGYRARPNGDDPDSCIFEAYALERFPEGQEPRPQNVFQPEISHETWQLVLCQDFQNMPEVQKGMKSQSFKGCVPSPLQEKPVINFHRNLAEFMGSGAPVDFP